MTARQVFAATAGAAALVGSAFVGDRTLSSHMVEHGLIVLVAAPLFAASAPVRTVLRSGPRPIRRGLASVLRRPAFRAVAHPLTAWLLFVAVMLGTHLTPFFDAAERHAGLHVLEHWLYFASALLFWMTLIEADPLPHRAGWVGRMLALLFAMPAMSLVGILLLQDERVRYPAYAGPGALADQHEAGRIMWLGGALVSAVLVFAVGWASLLAEERRQRRRDRYADAWS